MTRLFLDTNTVIGWIADRNPNFRAHGRAALARGDTFDVSVIVLHELQFGIAKSHRKPQSALALQQFLAGGVSVVPFQDSDALAAAEIRAALAAKGTPIGPYDVLIAGHARAQNATFVTSNTREFARVPELALLDWAK